MPRPRPNSWRRNPHIRLRMHRVHGLHLRGLANRPIATRLGVSESTVSRDLDRLHTLWLQARKDFADRERLRSLGTIRELDRLLWSKLERHKTDDDPTAITRLLRVFIAGQREIRQLLNSAPDEAAEENLVPRTIGEVVAYFSTEEIENNADDPTITEEDRREKIRKLRAYQKRQRR